MQSHPVLGADLTASELAIAAGSTWEALNDMTRQEAAAVIVDGGLKILLGKVARGEIAGAIGLGGANGTDLVCSILRPLPYLFPKIMISAVAGTAAVQWNVAESDICMYPSIGDISTNRVTKIVMENAAWAAAMAARNWIGRRNATSPDTPLDSARIQDMPVPRGGHHQDSFGSGTWQSHVAGWSQSGC